MSGEGFLHPLAEVFVVPSSISVVKGADGLEHLNRTLTADVSGLRLQGRQDALLCNANGRILDHLILCNLGEQVILVGNHGTGDETRRQLLQGVAWDEEVTVMNGDGAIGHLRLLGKAVDRCLVGLGIDPSEIDSQSWTEFGSALISRTNVGDSAITEILVPSVELESLVESLVVNGAETMDSARWSELRIRLGILERSEMNSSNLPFELGLHELIELDKGCYPGQEIHARMESRGRISRTLVRLFSDLPLPIGKHVSPNVGRITVTSHAEHEGGVVALAIIPNEARELEELVFEDGSLVKVELI